MYPINAVFIKCSSVFRRTRIWICLMAQMEDYILEIAASVTTLQVLYFIIQNSFMNKLKQLQSVCREHKWSIYMSLCLTPGRREELSLESYFPRQQPPTLGGLC